MQYVEGFLKCGKQTKTEPIWQYDGGTKLTLCAYDDLPDTYQVHFATDPEGTATVVEGDAEGTMIPDALLAEGKDIFAWVYVTDQDGGSTIGCIQIPVLKRAAFPSPNSGDDGQEEEPEEPQEPEEPAAGP